MVSHYVGFHIFSGENFFQFMVCLLVEMVLNKSQFIKYSIERNLKSV